MSDRRVLGVLLAIVTIGCDVARAIPADDYRSWIRLTPEAVRISFALAIQCAPVTDAQLERERKSHGPHTDRWVVVYANPAAAAALRDVTVTEFPEGAAIAKEKRHDPSEESADGVALMIKRSKKEFPATDGWEFTYRPAPLGESTYSGCADCHRAGGQKDYVFGRYGQRQRMQD
jgi:hypothetical protein